MSGFVVNAICVDFGVAGREANDAAAQDFRRMTKRYPDVSANCTDVKLLSSRLLEHIVKG